MKKKGQIDGLMNLIGPLIGIGIVLVVGFLIFAEIKVQPALQNSTGGDCTRTDAQNTYACNGTIAVQEAMDDIPGWLPIIVITVIGALLLSLVAYFRGR